VNRELLNKAAQKSLKDKIPEFRVGDTVTVSVRIVEGDKERLQPFRGTVIRRHGGGVTETFTVRRIVNNEGVERTFPLHSPTLVDVEVVRQGRTRRAKLYYLRDRVGKATRLRELAADRGSAVPKEAPDEEGPDEAEEPAEDKEG
jgi:large subunit ribosomal protein L19